MADNCAINKSQDLHDILNGTVDTIQSVYNLLKQQSNQMNE